MDAELQTLFSTLQIETNVPPPPPAQLRTVKDGFSSVFVFDIRPPSSGGAMVFRYDVELTELIKNKPLTMGGGDDGKKGLLRNICYELVKNVHGSTQGFGSQAMFVYDNRKIMFTNKAIGPMTLEIGPEQMSEYTRNFLRGASVNLEIKPCKTGRHEFDLNDLKSAMPERPGEQADHSLQQFLEMLTSQPFINAGTHDIIGMGRLFDRKVEKKLDDGIVTRNGIAKGVRIIGNNGNPKPALVADVKTCAFFAHENLETIVVEMMRKKRIDAKRADQMERFRTEFNRLFRGVSGYITYAPSRVVVIDSLTQRSVSEISFDVDGGQMSMVEFFDKKKNVRVNGSLPAIRQQQDRETLFPMSCIMILPNQRVSIEKMSEFISRELLNANTTDPNVRYKAITEEVKKIGTGDSCAFMHEFGVRLVGGSNDIQIGLHDMPKVKFGGNFTASFQDRINAAVQFLEPSNVLKEWLVAYPRQVVEEDIKNFVHQFTQLGRKKGMQLPAPQFQNIELDDLPDRMQQIANEFRFMMYIDKKYVKSHDILKLNEKRYGLLTQHVSYEVAIKARPMTLSNIVNKTNMKLYGYNYLPILPQAARDKFNMEGGEVLVIGVDTSLPSKATAFEKYMLKKRGLQELQSEDPMIVGICANYMQNPFKFCGDYYYQPCKQDALEPSSLIYKVGWILDKVKISRQKAPSMVFIIRGGVSEGMVPNNIRDEFPAYVQACKTFDPNWKPAFVYCIVDKKHNKRFFAKDPNNNDQAMNTMPGSVIDSKLPRVNTHEFWLQSHVPLKGTVKIPQYVFPINQTKANNNELQSFLLTLCCNWQIVTLAPALPTPVRQASELAKRGRNNFMEMKRNTPQFIPRVTDTQQIDCQQLNNRLCYNGHAFSNTRFNA